MNLYSCLGDNFLKLTNVPVALYATTSSQPACTAHFRTYKFIYCSLASRIRSGIRAEEVFNYSRYQKSGLGAVFRAAIFVACVNPVSHVMRLGPGRFVEFPRS